METEKLPPVLETMVAAETVKAEDIPEIEMAGRPMRAFYHPALYYTEVGLAAQIRRRLALPLPQAALPREDRRLAGRSRRRSGHRALGGAAGGGRAGAGEPLPRADRRPRNRQDD